LDKNEENLNSDILMSDDEVKEEIIFYYSPKSHEWNIHIKEGLLPNKNFYIVNKEIWEFFKKNEY